MNTKYFYRTAIALTIACMLFILGSCKKYLDQLPITAVGTETVFKDVESARSALVGVYQQLAGDDGYGLKVSLYFGVGEDLTQGPTGAADGSRRDFPLYATTASNSQMAAPYNRMFKGIQFANLCIDNIPKMSMYTSGTDQQKKQLQRMHGEALTLRAQFYFEAIRNWGDLPLHFETAEVLAAKDPFPKRTDRDTIYDHLLADLKTAANLVPWRNELTGIGDAMDERITKGTVKGLRARIALFRGGYSLRQDGVIRRPSDYKTFYQIARDETNEIITSNQHSLNPSFKNLWKNQVGGRVAADPNGELMFQVAAVGRSATADAKVGFNSGPTVVDPASSTNPAAPQTFGTASVFILPTYFYYFDSTDIRRDVTCVPYNDTVATDNVTFYKRGQLITSIFDGKYRRDWLNPTLPAGSYANNYTGFKWQILRYSDVLLMFAEAENEINGSPSASAISYVRAVNLRGHGGSYGPEPAPVIPTDKDGFFKFLVKERALELGGEGIRKFDLIRWNLLAKAISETDANLKKMQAFATMIEPTYMAGPPLYVLNTNNLPKKMYFKNRTSSDELKVDGIVVNSFYLPEPATTPPGTYSINWITNTLANTVIAHYASTLFKTGKSELLPIPQDAITAYGSFSANMPQNPGY